ncbi:hypothetical protein [Pseudonocardia sp. D17]|uniref:hypothetical protein n=1 Tax=Pseudonocardia sp. D17 TaxID=882661 RepID=UPI002B3F91BC|nr:hypothetical protein PSD17_39540 [Pseudonocardia sp. D17]
MSRAVEAANERRRAAARERGEATYPAEVIELWPACVVCGWPIRRNVDGPGPGLWRACRCPDVLWRVDPVEGGWERRVVDLNPPLTERTTP